MNTEYKSLLQFFELTQLRKIEWAWNIVKIYVSLLFIEVRLLAIFLPQNLWWDQQKYHNRLRKILKIYPKVLFFGRYFFSTAVVNWNQPEIEFVFLFLQTFLRVIFLKIFYWRLLKLARPNAEGSRMLMTLSKSDFWFQIYFKLFLTFDLFWYQYKLQNCLWRNAMVQWLRIFNFSNITIWKTISTMFVEGYFI